MKQLIFLVTMFTLMACGPGYQGSFRGNTSAVQTEGGSSFTSNTTGDVVFVFGTTKGIIGMMGGNSISFTVNNGSLTADPGQAFGSSSNGQTSTQTVTSGTGTLNGDSLSVSLSESYNVVSTTTRTGTLTITYTGTRI
jgi:hypothetical protein